MFYEYLPEMMDCIDYKTNNIFNLGETGSKGDTKKLKEMII